MKRFKLKTYIAGKALKQVYANVLSGDSLNNVSTKIREDNYIAGWDGEIASSGTITTDSTFYNNGIFNRKYSVKNPDFDNNGVDLSMIPTDSDIVSITQFGDFAFNLTNETSLGTKYALTTTPEADGWLREKHEIVTYNPNPLSGHEIDLVIHSIPFNVTQESPDIVFGFLSGGEVVLYQDELSTSGSVYSLSGGIPNSLPFAYLFEQPLNYSANFLKNKIIYGGIDSSENTFVYTPSVTLSGDTTYSKFPDEEDDEMKVYYNPFKLKNMYNYNWNTEINRTTKELTGARDYIKVGSAQREMWLSYKYYRENPTKVQDFELLERVAGLYKYRPKSGHKSNIYSIRINNSGINQIEDSKIKTKIKTVIENSIHETVKKIAPASTQLWKIDYTGV